MNIEAHMKRYRVAPVLEVARLRKVFDSLTRFLNYGFVPPVPIESDILERLFEDVEAEVDEYLERDNKERVNYFNFITRRIKRHGEGN